MRSRFTRLSALLCLPGLAMSSVHLGAQPAVPSSPAPANNAVEAVATGSFDVTLTPSSEPDDPIASFALSKTFHGDLEGTSAGHMLAVSTPVEGSAGYVAMERVSATLEGRTGTFALQHSGSMAAGTQSLSITVVPDSGTQALTGLEGSMDITIEGAQHFYTLRYSLPSVAQN